VASDILDRVPHPKLKIHNLLDAGAATVSEVEQGKRNKSPGGGSLSKRVWGFFSVQWWTVSEILIMTITIHYFQNPSKVK